MKVQVIFLDTHK